MVDYELLEELKRDIEEQKARRRPGNKLAQRRYNLRVRERKAGRPMPEMCDICNRGGRIVFDHCHNSSKFRGWLCQSCNVVLGLVNEDIVLLEKLIVYLKANREE